MKSYPVWLSLEPTRDASRIPVLAALAVLNPGDPVSLKVLAELYHREGRDREAVAMLRRAAARRRTDSAMLELAAKWAGASIAAEDIYSELSRRFPDEWKYRVALGENRVDRADYAGAIAILAPIAQADVDSWSAAADYQLARCWYLLKKPKEALTYWETAKTLDGLRTSSVGALRFKGQILDALGKRSEAVAIYRRTSEKDPDNKEILPALVQLELENGDQDGLRHLRRYSVLADGDAASTIAAAEFYLRLGRDDDAVELAGRVGDGQWQEKADRVLGLAYYRKGKYDKAATHLTKAAAAMLRK